MKANPMTDREVNGILEILDTIRYAHVPLDVLVMRARIRGDGYTKGLAYDIEQELRKIWKVAQGMLDRGGWVLFEGSETGVPMARPKELDAVPLELAGTVGEGCIPDDISAARESMFRKVYPEPVTGEKERVTKVAEVS